MNRPTAHELLAALREMPTENDLYAAAQARVGSRLGISLAGAAVSLSPGSAGTALPASLPQPDASALFSIGARRFAGWLAAAFAAGALSGGALEHWRSRQLQPARIQLSTTPVASAPASAALQVAELSPSAAPTSPAPNPSAPALASTARGAFSGGSRFAAEQTLLDAARAALTQGEPERSMRLLESHAARFPNGVLSEEREALAIRALVATSRYGEAELRADGFQRRYPNSLFAPTVSAAIAKIPRQKELAPSKP
ncbi:MAG TPA: hypothetical protein VGM29_07345 [Polyangiaceae bacterium]|jgi:hypothetical protein